MIINARRLRPATSTTGRDTLLAARLALVRAERTLRDAADLARYDCGIRQALLAEAEYAGNVRRLVERELAG